MKHLWILRSFLILSLCLSLGDAALAKHTIQIKEHKVHLEWDEKHPKPEDARSWIDDVNITLPQVTGLADKQLEHKINSHLKLNKLYDYPLTLDEIEKEFYEGNGSVEAIGYDVNYLDENILDIEVYRETVAAYPDTQHANRCINLKTGDLVKPEDIFIPSKMNDLFKLIKTKKAADEEDTRMHHPESLEDFERILEDAPPYTKETLKKFSINKDGIRFLYSYGAPHAFRNLDTSSFDLSYEELKPFLKPDGLLGHKLKG